MMYGSVCSGIESASIAWGPLGLKAAWFSEIEPFPSVVLAHHWPHVNNVGDMTNLPDMIDAGGVTAPDILVGGTPCQAFSVAGARKGLADKRGQLTLTYVDIFNAIDRKRGVGNESVCVWENVPGVLSSKDNAFGCFLGALAGESCELQPAGKKWTNAGCVFGPQRTIAWRVLDAQHFGVAQRRRRVFVVASARKGFDPTKVLFESEGVRRDIAPSREKKTVVAALTASGVGTCGADDYKDATDLITCFDSRQDPQIYGNMGGPCGASTPQSNAVSVHCFKAGQGAKAGGIGYAEEISPTLTATDSGTQQSPGLLQESTVRRLTPVECERLQGFPDNHTQVAWRGKPPTECPDGHRYKAIGNSKAVPVIKFVGERILKELSK